MRWIDVAGLPGSGKSAICNPIWPAKIYKTGTLAKMQPGTDEFYPSEWSEFLTHVDGLISKMSIRLDAIITRRLTDQAFSKMALVSKIKNSKIFMQTAFVQRILGIGYRLFDPEGIAEYLRLMPVSLGVALLDADDETLRWRNINRCNGNCGKNFSFMITPQMREVMDIIRRGVRERGVPLLELDTTRPADENIRNLLAFAHSAARLADSRAA